MPPNAEPAPATKTTAELVAARELWSMKDAAYRLAMSVRNLYYRVEAGDIEVVRVGRRVFITDDEIKRYVATLKAAAS